MRSRQSRIGCSIFRPCFVSCCTSFFGSCVVRSRWASTCFRSLKHCCFIQGGMHDNQNVCFPYHVVTAGGEVHQKRICSSSTWIGLVPESSNLWMQLYVGCPKGMCFSSAGRPMSLVSGSWFGGCGGFWIYGMNCSGLRFGWLFFCRQMCFIYFLW